MDWDWELENTKKMYFTQLVTLQLQYVFLTAQKSVSSLTQGYISKVNVTVHTGTCSDFLMLAPFLKDPFLVIRPK